MNKETTTPLFRNGEEFQSFVPPAPSVVEIDPASSHDSELISLIRKGDEKAFQEFYKKHATVVLSFANKQTNNPGEAEEICQIVWIKCWEKKFRGFILGSTFCSWMYQVVHYTTIDYLRFKYSGIKRHMVSYGKWEKWYPDSLVDHRTPVQDAVDKNIMDNIWAAVNMIHHPLQREAVWLCILGYTTSEIQKRMGLKTRSSAKSHIVYGKEKIKKLLKRDGEFQEKKKVKYPEDLR